MSAEAWLPQRLFPGRDDAELWNALVSWAGEPIPLGRPQALLRFALAEAPVSGAPVFRIEAGGVVVQAISEAFPFRGMTGADIEVSDLARLPLSLRAALAQGMIDLIWPALPENRLGAARVAAVVPFDPAVSGPLEWFTADFTGFAAEPIRFRIGASAADVLALLRRERIAASRIRNAIARHLNVTAHRLVGSLRLSIAALGRLNPGDLVVLAAQTPDLESLKISGVVHQFQRNQNDWIYLGSVFDESERPTSPAPRDDAMDEAKTTGDLDVTVDFDIGRLELPLAAVEGWKPGAVVPLGQPAPAEAVEVTMRVNGKVVGQGDLVRVDDRIAVRITRLLAPRQG